MMPSLWRRYSNYVFGKVLVKMSTICSIEGIKFSWTTLFVTWSLKKWYLIGMFLVLEWRTGFLDTLMVLVAPREARCSLAQYGRDVVTFVCDTNKIILNFIPNMSAYTELKLIIKNKNFNYPPKTMFVRQTIQYGDMWNVHT